mmetsp:Transcript_3044/g.11046  ORF Transcript_3044/g.11046 Transcript_3044/m.11046 type:complete len:257 (+) Transcript_3044:1008-1778(+)
MLQGRVRRVQLEFRGALEHPRLDSTDARQGVCEACDREGQARQGGEEDGSGGEDAPRGGVSQRRGAKAAGVWVSLFPEPHAECALPRDAAVFVRCGAHHVRLCDESSVPFAAGGAVAALVANSSDAVQRHGFLLARRKVCEGVLPRRERRLDARRRRSNRLSEAYHRRSEGQRCEGGEAGVVERRCSSALQECCGALGQHLARDPLRREHPPLLFLSRARQRRARWDGGVHQVLLQRLQLQRGGSEEPDPQRTHVL